MALVSDEHIGRIYSPLNLENMKIHEISGAEYCTG